MTLTTRTINRYTTHCLLDEPATVTITSQDPVIADQGHTTYYRCKRWNMSRVIARYATIKAGEQKAVLEWQDGKVVKVGGDLEIEIEVG